MTSELPPPGAGAEPAPHPADTRPAPTRASRAAGREDRPNYLVRRLLVAGVALVVVAGVVAALLLTLLADDEAGPAVDGSTVAVVDLADGTVTFYDATDDAADDSDGDGDAPTEAPMAEPIAAVVTAGTELTPTEPDDATDPTGATVADAATDDDVDDVDVEALADPTAVVSGRVLDVHTDGRAVVLVRSTSITRVLPPGGSGDFDQDDVQVRSVAIPAGSTVTRLPTGDALTLLVAPRERGDLLLVGASAAFAEPTVVDIATVAELDDPLLFAETARADPSATRLAVGDGRDFQTVVVGLDDAPVVFLPGVPMAVGDSLVATSQNIGPDAELGLFDPDGSRRATVPSPRPVGGVIDDERFVYVTADGRILAAGVGDRDPEELGTISIPADDRVTTVRPALGHTRLVVSGARFEALVDLAGAVLHLTTFPAEITTFEPDTAWTCLPVGGPDRADAVIDLSNGAALADLRADTVPVVAASGCAVALDRSGTVSIVSGTDRQALPAGATVDALAPQGAAAVIRTAAGVTEIRRFDEPVTITLPAGAAQRAVFLDR